MTTIPPSGPPLRVVVGGEVNDEEGAASAGPAEELAAILTSRAIIEQAKGMLMFVYGVDADDAFDILRWQSQEHNIKLLLIAEQILTDLIQLSLSKGPASQVRVGGLMVNAHKRVASVATRYRNRANTTSE